MNAFRSQIIIVLITLTIPFIFSSGLTAQDYNIMPLGNSITASNNGLYSYRYHLWQHLLDDGVSFDFVGTLNENQGGNPAWPDYLGHSFDPDHEGHPGWRADGILDDLSLWLDEYLVDIALVHVGTNDLLANGSDENVAQTVEDIEEIITVLRMHNAHIAIFLAQIIPIDLPVDTAVVKLNAAIPGIAVSMYDPSSPIHIVDQYSGIDVDNDLLNDGIHPNASGEEKMGLAWYNALAANLPDPVNRWTGGISSSWYDPGNWSLSHLPTSDEDVVVSRAASYWPAVSGGIQVGSDCRSLTVESTGELAIDGDLIVQQSAELAMLGHSTLELTGSLLKSENNFGGGKSANQSGGTYQKSHHYNIFDCITPFQLVSVKIYATENQYVDPGYRTFYWATSDGTIQEQKDVWVELGESRINLGFSITTGTNHRLGVLSGLSDDPTLYRDRSNAGLDYPFAIGDVGSVTSSDKGQNYYYWMYDFEYTSGSGSGNGQTNLLFGESEIRFTGEEESFIEAGAATGMGGKTEVESEGNYSSFATFNRFDCLHPFIINSAKVVASASGLKTFYWGTSDGTIVQEKEVFIPAGESRVELNFIVTPGINHRLGTSVAGGPELWRDKSDEGLNYPYFIGDVGMITESKIGEGYYYYLFDLAYTVCLNDLTNETSGKTLSTRGNLSIAGDLKLQAGAFFTIESGDTVMVGHRFTMKSGEESMSSLLNFGELILLDETDVELYLTPDVWHYVSSPVEGALSEVFTGNYLYSFDEASYSWSNIVSTSVPLEPMQGFNAWVSDDAETIHFTGSPTTGMQSVSLTRNDGQANPGWNLLGNPYPSYLDWDAAGWEKSQVNNTLYYWSGVGGGAGGNYSYYIGGDGENPGVGVNGGTSVIPPMQGYFVQASGNGSISVNNDARVHGDQGYYKQAEESTLPLIRLLASNNNGRTDETVVRFSETSVAGFDGEEDAWKLISDDFPQIYSTHYEEIYAINTLPLDDKKMVVPLEFIAPASGNHSLSLAHMEGFGPLTEVYLEDLQTGQMQQLLDKPDYDFYYDDPSAVYGFLLHCSTLTGVDVTEAEPQAMLYAHLKDVYVRMPESSETIQVRIYDVMGQLLLEKRFLDGNFIRFNSGLPGGHYIVTAVCGATMLNKKVFIE